MAIFGWLQKWLNVFFVWLGAIGTEDSNWDNLSTQLNLLNDQLTQQSYATAYDFNIKSLPIDSYILFPKHLWIYTNAKKHSVIDGVLYCPNQYKTSATESTNLNKVFKTEDLVNFNEVNSIVSSYSGYYLGNLAIRQLDEKVRIIKNGDWYYGSYNRYSYIDGERTTETYKEAYDLSGAYVDSYCQTLYGSAIIQLIKGSGVITDAETSSSFYSEIFINGSIYDLNIPISGTSNYMGSISTCYNSLPSVSLAQTDSIYTRYDLASGVYFYVMYGDILYQYNSDFEIINIYHIPFPNFGMIYINGSLHFLVKTGVVKCNLS